jgi:hypothetical protein
MSNWLDRYKTREHERSFPRFVCNGYLTASGVLNELHKLGAMVYIEGEDIFVRGKGEQPDEIEGLLNRMSEIKPEMMEMLKNVTDIRKRFKT